MTRCLQAQLDRLGSDPAEDARAHNIVCVHAVAATFAGVDGGFQEDGFGVFGSHFDVRGDGFAKPWQDLDFTRRYSE